MNVLAQDLVPAFGLFCVSLVLVTGSLRLAERVAPMFFRGLVKVPTTRSFFTNPKAEIDGGWDRSAVGLLALVFCVIGACGLFVISEAVRALGLF